MAYEWGHSLADVWHFDLSRAVLHWEAGRPWRHLGMVVGAAEGVGAVTTPLSAEGGARRVRVHEWQGRGNLNWRFNFFRHSWSSAKGRTSFASLRRMPCGSWTRSTPSAGWPSTSSSTHSSLCSSSPPSLLTVYWWSCPAHQKSNQQSTHYS